MTFLGKLATWILYAALGFVLVTEEGTTWPLVILWIGIARPGCRSAVLPTSTKCTRRALKPAPGEGTWHSPRMESLKLRLTPRIGDCFTHLTDEERRLVEPLPDLATLTDDDLRVMIRELEKEGGRDLLPAPRAPRTHRHPPRGAGRAAARAGERGEAKLADVERLSEILAGKATSSGARDE